MAANTVIQIKPDTRKVCLGCNELVPNRNKKGRPGAERCLPCQQIEDRKNLKYRT